jgi:hypothetical protein
MFRTSGADFHADALHQRRWGPPCGQRGVQRFGGLGQDDLDGGPGHNHLDSVIEREGGRDHERYCRSRPGGRDEGQARDGRGQEKQK